MGWISTCDLAATPASLRLALCAVQTLEWQHTAQSGLSGSHASCSGCPGSSRTALHMVPVPAALGSVLHVGPINMVCSASPGLAEAGAGCGRVQPGRPLHAMQQLLQSDCAAHITYWDPICWRGKGKGEEGVQSDLRTDPLPQAYSILRAGLIRPRGSTWAQMAGCTGCMFDTAAFISPNQKGSEKNPNCSIKKNKITGFLSQS